MWAVLGCPFVLMAYTVTDYPVAMCALAGVGALCGLAAMGTAVRDFSILWRER